MNPRRRADVIVSSLRVAKKTRFILSGKKTGVSHLPASHNIPESRLTKKHNPINFHINREAVAAGIMRVAYEPTATNRADALTKNVAFEVKQKHLHDL